MARAGRQSNHRPASRVGDANPHIRLLNRPAVAVPRKCMPAHPPGLDRPTPNVRHLTGFPVHCFFSTIRSKSYHLHFARETLRHTNCRNST